jgi:hypothetical protein
VKRSYRLLKLPKYLIFHLTRSEKNINFKQKERNHTIVTFPGTYDTPKLIAMYCEMVENIYIYLSLLTPHTAVPCSEKFRP